jgi:phosphoglycolate phosphatase
VAKPLEECSLVRAVLFDLDGTLVDSAPDLAHAGNLLRLRRSLEPLPLSAFRPMTGAGARGMLSIALGVAPSAADFEALKDEFLEAYAGCLTRSTHVFADVAPVLDALDASGLAWGVVTNKAERFARPVVEGVGLAGRSSVLVCGDTLPRAKPFPDPLIEAARRMGLNCGECIYVGDDLRDVQAGRAAGMATVAVRWGYLGLGDSIEQWGADHVISQPEELLNLLHLP